MTTQTAPPPTHAVARIPLPPRKRPEPPKPRQVETRQRGRKD